MSVGKFITETNFDNGPGRPRSDQYFLYEIEEGHFVWFHPLQAEGGDVVEAPSEIEAWNALENWADKSGMKLKRP